jgi:hypothetical protein
MSLKRNLQGDLIKLQKPKGSRKFRRSGKWSAEEEALAIQLIVEFENGTFATDVCSSGCTLRSFLSRRLMCAPMRISKKFAKKQIGKLMYTPRSNLHEDPPDQSKLKLLEATYFASNPFDGEEGDEMNLAFPMTDGEAGTDGSISSDGDEESGSYDSRNMIANSAAQLFDDFIWVEDEAEDWKNVLSYYFPQNEEISQI